MSPTKPEHMKLYLSHGRPADAVEAIQDDIVGTIEKELNGIIDPEVLLSMRKGLRDEIDSQESKIERLKASYVKSNKKREANVKKWEKFTADVAELMRKYGIDLPSGVESHLTHGRTYSERLLNSRPDIATYDGSRLPQKRDDGLLDDDKILLFRMRAKAELLQAMIGKKAMALKELFNDDLE